jgi:hypothetical protein
VVLGHFLSTRISRLKKGSKSQGEKSEDFKKIFRKLEILNPKLEIRRMAGATGEIRNRLFEKGELTVRPGTGP